MVTYGQYIQVFLKVDEDSKGLYVEVPGYDVSETFKVHCEENDVCPQVTHCRCSHFAHKGTCEHAQSAQSFWNRIYKTNIQKHQESIAKANEKALEQAMDEAELLDEQYEEAAFIEQIAATEDQTTSTVKIAQPVASSNPVPKVVKIDYRSAYAVSFFNALPSRQKTAA